MADRTARRRPVSAARRVAVTVVGGLVTLAGSVMLFLPPLPGLLVTAAGLGLLATEYAWAARWLASVRARQRRPRAGGVSGAHGVSGRQSLVEQIGDMPSDRE